MKLLDNVADLKRGAGVPAVKSAVRRTSALSGSVSPSASPAIRSQTGWWVHFLAWLLPWAHRLDANRNHGKSPPVSSGQGEPSERDSNQHRPQDEIPSLAKRLINEDRYAFVLLKEAADEVSERNAQPAWCVLHHQMALVPGGRVPVVLCDGTISHHEVGGFFLDRYAVTNRQFRKFVQSGGYDWLEIWPQEVWPSVSRFTDRKGRPGPRDWEDGKFLPGQADHPVVGVSWYEATAYARWVGKRLPTAAEWQKAGGWPEQLSGGDCNRFPWGDLFDPARQPLGNRHRTDRPR